MTVKKITMGLLGGLIILVIGMISSRVFEFVAPSIGAEYQNPGMFRSWSDPLMLLFFVHPFLLGLVLAWVWSNCKGLLKDGTDVMKGANFGAVIWLMSTVPGMLITYSSFAISLLMVFSWTVNSLIELVAVGVFFARTLK